MATKKGVVEVVAWGNVSQQWKITQIVLTQQGRIQEFFIGGGGGSKLWFRMDCWTFLSQITSPHTPSHQSRLHVINPSPLTCTWILLVKGCTLGTFSSCARNCRPAEKAETTTCFSICECRSPMAREILLCEQRRTDHRRVPENNYISEYPWKLV